MEPPSLRIRPLTRSALEWATAKHGDQVSEVAAPFILHLLEVAALLSGRDCEDEVVAATDRAGPCSCP